jgi:DNA mismatch repair protein MutS
VVEADSKGNDSNGDGVSESILDIDSSRLTPGMKQYQDAKRENPDCLIMLRMGDFYEMFYEDAVTAARELEITLTARGKGEKRAPLAGVPYHALEGYLGRLVKKGFKVAIIEQLEDPKQAKGLVKRGLVRIVTPGTVIESSMLDEKENNYLMSLGVYEGKYAVAFCDLSTGEFFTHVLDDLPSLFNDIIRFNPQECIVPESLKVDRELVERIKSMGCFVNSLEDYYFRPGKAREVLLNHFNFKNLESFGLEDKKLNVSVSGGLLKYLLETQKNSLSHIKKISLKSNQNNMILDGSTLRNLELVKNIKDGTSRGSLLSVLDKTVTAMGARLLKKWMNSPLLKKERIVRRLDAISELNKKVIKREEMIELLKDVYDLERLISRVNYGNASPRDLLSLGKSLESIPRIKENLEMFGSDLLVKIKGMKSLTEIKELLKKSIREDAPVTIREGGMIEEGYNSELDELRSIKNNSKQYLTELEEKEKSRTGINSLRIRFNRVFGYFIEVTKKNIHLVPSTYIRKQTTANSERYITEELKVEEEKILGAQEKIEELEYKLFQEIISEIALETVSVQGTAKRLAVLDVLCSLAKVAMENNYVKPAIVDENVMQIKNGRHPVVERIESRFIPNDVMLDDGEMMIITGPNMAGKSTVMRQAALIALMAQMGSFVPADEVVMGVVDRIFTRVGAYDDLSSGQSTFMVEMTETASILNNATANSLIILDEIGRGTSTFDGVSIAWSVAEYICNKLKAKTLFATHYHVMNKLSDKFSRVKNFNIAVREVKGEVVFLHKLIAGGTDQSYGVHVAKLAGLPSEVVSRAKEIQMILEKDDEMMRKIKAKKLEEQRGLGEF